LMIEHGATNWNRGMTNASYGKYLNIIELMIEHGANNWEMALIRACRTRNVVMAEYMIKRGAVVTDRIMNAARRKPHNDKILELLSAVREVPGCLTMVKSAR
jgi:hypothetical protein